MCFEKYSTKAVVELVLWRKVQHDRNCSSENKKSFVLLLSSTQINNP